MPTNPTLAPGLPSAMHILTQESEAGGIRRARGGLEKNTFPILSCTRASLRSASLGSHAPLGLPAYFG